MKHTNKAKVELPCAGTVTNIREASLWLSYTYLFVRMLRNPLAYGVGWEELTADPRLEGRRYFALSLHPWEATHHSYHVLPVPSGSRLHIQPLQGHAVRQWLCLHCQAF